MFDLINDPNEIINVYDREEYKEIWNELKDKLIELQIKYEDPVSEYPEMVLVINKYW